MQSLAASAIMIGLVFFFAIFAPVFNRAQLQAEAQAANFINYRNAVNKYALEHKIEGSIPNSALALPDALAAMPWQNLTVWEDDELRCYVFGPGSAATVAAALRMMRGSAAFGWSDNGRLVRSGPELALPGLIEDGDLVSVIIVDRVGGL